MEVRRGSRGGGAATLVAQWWKRRSNGGRGATSVVVERWWSRCTVESRLWSRNRVSCGREKKRNSWLKEESEKQRSDVN